LTLSDPVFILAGLMRLVWQPGTGSSRVGAARACGYRGSLWGALLGEVQKCRGSPPPEFSKLIRAASDVEVTVPIARQRASRKCCQITRAKNSLGSLHAESGLSIVAIKLSLIFLLFSQTKQHVSVLHGVSCVALGF